MDPETNAERSFVLCSMFESEVLIWLLLKHWHHPFANNGEYRTSLLENATAVLDAARSGESIELIPELPSKDMNLIAAIWYAEMCTLAENDAESEKRNDFLRSVRRQFPSCFCDSDQFL